MTGSWHFFADRGGTFTDLLALAPDGGRHLHKLLSHAPGQYDDAVLAGMCAIMDIDPAALRDAPVASLRLGTTVTTNALLEGRTSACALLTNDGFEDLLAIGDQSRPELFALRIPPRPQLARHSIGLPVRRDVQGRIIAPLDRRALDTALRRLRDEGIDSLAVALLHATACPDDELQVRACAEALGFTTICCSHEVSSEPGLLARAQTAVVEAALAPVLQGYIERLRAALPNTRILFMQSDGRLADAAQLHARNSIYSGPAGGVTGATRTANAVNLRDIVGLDMGGTSTDVFCTDGTPPVRDVTRIRDQMVRAPSIDLHTVAAGGGSRLIYQDRRLRVGPESAGADPGPACYGRGGPAAITDANVLLGRVWLPGFAPRFGADGRRPIDPRASRHAIEALAQTMAADDPALATDADAALKIARGALRIATDNMAGAVRRISVARGIDIRDHALVAFGGAGAQHACAIAEALGMRRVLVPARASVLSAAGMQMAPVGVELSAAVDAPLDQDGLDRARAALQELQQRAETQLRAQGETVERVDALLRLHYARADTVIDLPVAKLDAVRRSFTEAHERRFGFADPERPVLLASVRLRASGRAFEAPEVPIAERAARIGHQAMWLDEGAGWQDVPVYERIGREPVHGPALLLLDQSTFVLERGWSARACAQGMLASAEHATPAAESSDVHDPMQRELYNNRFMAVAEEMGEALRRSAHSINVRNRLDYSCAVFDAQGSLVANAPHIPVHLGSMGAAVRAVLADHGPELAAGDGWLINDPYRGGTHLPDLTLVMPVWFGDPPHPAARSRGGRGAAASLRDPSAFVAARAHHADIGGIAPGSMPADSRHIDEEGVRISGVRIAAEHVLDAERVRQLLADNPYPARDPDANLADLRAQLAACSRGARLLAGLAARHGEDTVPEAMRNLLMASETAVRERLAGLRAASHSVTMDSGAVVRVALAARSDALHVDFRGSGAPDAGNENAPEAVVRAAVMYALRCWIDAPVALNEGFLRAVTLELDRPSLLSPQPPSAVVAGNVETSQAITDALLAALDCMAESQGTMNNIAIGSDRFQYYETLCGGAGATADTDGASAVHTHMTNSRITDAEIIERHYPLRVTRFALRRGSGGRGRHRGGDGVERAILFLAPARVSLLTNRRRYPPRGLHGGGDGATGENRLIRADDAVEVLPPRASVEVKAGDSLCIATPGGGGFGYAND